MDLDFADAPRPVRLSLLSGRGHYQEVIAAVQSARTSVWIGTANLKDLTTALLPHGVSWLTPGMQIASLDHVMWFHQPFRVDQWLLHVMDSPSASGARGLVRGRVYTERGELVASTAQEGLVRKR